MASSSKSKRYKHQNQEPEPSHFHDNERNHQLRITIEGQYKPLNTHGNPPLDAIERRGHGEKSLDLWDHRSIYPKNPSTDQHPPCTRFKFVKNKY
jgi:hypothetical protein